MQGKIIRETRRRLGLTQGQLSELMDVDQGTVSRWERGIENPRPGRVAKLQELLCQDEEQRAWSRSVSLIKHNFMPATLLDDKLRLVEASRSAQAHFCARGRDIATLMGITLDQYADRSGIPELARLVRESGILTGDALLFRFAVNERGSGHVTVYEPLFKSGKLMGVMNYATSYFKLPKNNETTLELVQVVTADDWETVFDLHRGQRADFIEQMQQ